MPNVLKVFDALKNKNKLCDGCFKSKANYYVPVVPGVTKRMLFFCDKCMSRNTHLLFNAGREIEKFSANDIRRKNNEDLPDMTMPNIKNKNTHFGTID